MAAMDAASSGPSPPSRRASSAGDEKAFSIGICWSSTMPMSRARGSRLTTASASASPERWSASGCHGQDLGTAPGPMDVPRGRGAGRLSPCTSRPRSTTASVRCSRWRPPGRRRPPSTSPGEQGLPPRFLGAILADLRRAGVVASQRGAEGGYRLARDPDAITIADVIRALDGPARRGAGLPARGHQLRRGGGEPPTGLGRRAGQPALGAREGHPDRRASRASSRRTSRSSSRTPMPGSPTEAGERGAGRRRGRRLPVVRRPRARRDGRHRRGARRRAGQPAPPVPRRQLAPTRS